ncbi:MAG: 2-polyprenylphenol 6-hydroxylase [Pseudomonadota bacterium]
MFSILSDFWRLTRAGFVLSRHDALIPREYEQYLPMPLRGVGTVLRLGARTSEGGRALRPGERLAKAFEGLGPFYVKTGQFMATRPDIIGFEMAADLSRLQDKMPAFDQSLAVAEIEKTYGQKIGDIFPEFSTPIAAASIAQAHKATLSDGRKVAVKVLRPNIERRAAKDFRALGRAAAIIERLVPSARRMEPKKFIATLREAAEREFDLRLEAGAASELADNLADDKSIRIPQVIWPLSSKRILTLEWIEGTGLGDLEALEDRQVDNKALARHVLQSFLTQALHQGFFHADMHQGNMIVDEQKRLVLIDFGIMGRLDEAARNTFAQILYGFINRDYLHTAKMHFDAGYVPDHHSIEAFAQALRSVGEPLYGQDAAGMDMSRVLQQLFDVTELFDMHLRPELIMLQRTMVTVEGVARMLDPTINMWETAEPVVRTYIADRVGPRYHAERLRDAVLKTAEMAPRLPGYVEDIANAAARIADNKVTLSDETTASLAAALGNDQRSTRRVVLVAGVIIAILLVFLIRG